MFSFCTNPRGCLGQTSKWLLYSLLFSSAKYHRVENAVVSFFRPRVICIKRRYLSDSSTEIVSCIRKEHYNQHPDLSNLAFSYVISNSFIELGITQLNYNREKTIQFPWRSNVCYNMMTHCLCLLFPMHEMSRHFSLQAHLMGKKPPRN